MEARIPRLSLEVFYLWQELILTLGDLESSLTAADNASRLAFVGLIPVLLQHSHLGLLLLLLMNGLLRWNINGAQVTLR